MKNIDTYIKESFKLRDDTKIIEPENLIHTTVGKLVMWYTGQRNTIDLQHYQSLIDNGWFEVFGDDSNSARKCADFVNKNFDKDIDLICNKITTDYYEVEFTLNKTKYVLEVSELSDLDEMK